MADAAAITIAATLGTAPLMAVHFEQISLAALPANLLAAPAIAPVMWLGVLAAAAAQIAAPLATPFSALTAPLLVYLQKIAHLTASVAAVRRRGPRIPGGDRRDLDRAARRDRSSACGAFGRACRRRAVRCGDETRRGGIASAGAAMPRAVARRRRGGVAARLATACRATLALLVLAGGIPGRGARAAPARAGELVVSFLDIGQGDATLLQLDGTSVLVDTGPPDGPILKRLAEAGVKRLDALVLTHAETDHEGAAPAVIRRYRAAAGRRRRRGLAVRRAAGAPERASPRAMDARSGPPRARRSRSGRCASRCCGRRPRDRGERVERQPERPRDRRPAWRSGSSRCCSRPTRRATSPHPLQLEPVDVLKVAHHGSADPGLPALLARLRPRIAAIEVGRGNRYGHPTPSTLAALNQAVPTVLRTDRDGTVRLHVAGDRMWVQR